MQAGVPVLIWGSPGEGKSSVVESLAESLEMRVEVVIGSVRDADFVGLPMRSDDGVVFAPPAWARRCLDGTPTVVFLDEQHRTAINAGRDDVSGARSGGR